MMKNVDFLPTRYHERDLRRQAQIWRYLVLLAFGSVICAATLGQLVLKQAAQARVVAFQQVHFEAQQKQARLKQLQTDLAATAQVAELYVYLQHPWPCSQLLTQLMTPLPANVTLGELTVLQDGDATEGTAPNFQLVASDKDVSNLPPSQRDLANLRRRHDGGRTRIQLSGTTRDTSALNEYVQALNRSRLFQSAKLVSLESTAADQSTPDSRFEVQVVVRPGYGQPGGPREPPVGPITQRPAIGPGATR